MRRIVDILIVLVFGSPFIGIIAMAVLDSRNESKEYELCTQKQNPYVCKCLQLKVSSDRNSCLEDVKRFLK